MFLREDVHLRDELRKAEHFAVAREEPGELVQIGIVILEVATVRT